MNDLRITKEQFRERFEAFLAKIPDGTLIDGAYIGVIELFEALESEKALEVKEVL